jgi:hypothetical protein
VSVSPDGAGAKWQEKLRSRPQDRITSQSHEYFPDLGDAIPDIRRTAIVPIPPERTCRDAEDPVARRLRNIEAKEAGCDLRQAEGVVGREHRTVFQGRATAKACAMNCT